MGELFHPEAAAAIRDAIAAAGGNEVFFVGRRGPGFAVAEVQVLARGHQSAVPAVLRAVRAGEVIIHNHPSGHLTPSEADLGIAAQGGASGIAFVIVDNQATSSYTVVEPMAPVERHPVTTAEIDQLLGPSGSVAAALPGYEHRQQQIDMAREVAQAFNDDRVLLVEAGTGTGKSLAYLLPAILCAVRNRERVVVSTNTINLQEQLIGRDLPFLRDKLGLEFKSVLLKGRSNYLCQRKAGFARAEQDKLFDEPGRATLKTLLEWAGKTKDGSRSDLSFPVPEDLWEEVAADGDDCLRVKSPFYHQCFFFDSRRQAAAADVIVVNHHLLMADLATRAATGDYTATAVLPPYDRVIIDEAHNLEDVAASYFGAQVTGLGLRKALGRLQPERDPHHGVLMSLAERLEGRPDLETVLGEAIAGRAQLGEAVKRRFAAIGEQALAFLAVDDPGREEHKARLTKQSARHPAFADGILPEARALVGEVGDYSLLLARMLESVRRSSALDEGLTSTLLRIESVRHRLEGAAEALSAFAVMPSGEERDCRWVEVRRLRSGEVGARLASAPLAVGEMLAERVYDKLKSVVLTSATLTVGRKFDHFRDRLGVSRLDPRRVTTARFESPFDFARQALVLVAVDMPEPQEPSFAQAVRETVIEAVERSRGRAFLLFTSYGLLERTWRGVEGQLRSAGLSPLKQGTAPRDQLVDRFRRETGSVLFAVDSFWEGVDVPGEALSLVVLVRLPFKVPTEPLQQARVEAIERRGGDPFLEYSVPQAVIKFRQGFGRLIRTRDDRGCVLVLDRRVTTKRYGRLFLESLPAARVVQAPRVEVLKAMAEFFADGAAAALRVKPRPPAATARGSG